MNTKIYCAYHDDKQIEEYNLKSLDKKIYELFDVKIIKNDFHKYFSEASFLYYLWKNDLNLDIIGLCHYRRFFNINEVDFNEIYNTNKIITFNSGGGNYNDLIDFSCVGYDYNKNLKEKIYNKIYNSFINFLNINGFKLKNDYDKYINNEILFIFGGNNMFICKYDTFKYINNIYWSYIEYLFPNFENNLYKYFGEPNRQLGYVTEIIFGFLLRNIDYNNNYFEDLNRNLNYVYILNDGKSEEINYIKKLYKKHLIDGFNTFYIVTNNIIVDNYELLNEPYFYTYIKIIDNINKIGKELTYNIIK